MLLGFLVVADAYEEDVACVVGNLRRIILLLDLADGGICGMVEFQLDYECRLGDVATRNHHKVGIALACGVLTMDDVFVLGPDIGNGKDAGKRVLIVVGEDAGVLIVGEVDGFRHGLLVARDGGSEKVSGILYCFGQSLPRCSLYRVIQFISNFLVGNISLECILIVCQIAKMN